MRQIILIIVCIFITLQLNGQNYFSKHIDIGNTGWQDLVKSMVEENDTIYFLSFNVTDVTDSSFIRSSQVCKMSLTGELIDCKLFKGFSPNLLYETLIIKNDTIFILAGSCCYENSRMRVLLLNQFSLDSLNVFEYSIAYDSLLYFADTDIQLSDSFIYLSGWANIADGNSYVSEYFLIKVNRKSMLLDSVLTLPFDALSKKYEELFVDDEGKLTAYYLLNRLEGEGNFNSRGFIRYNEDMEVEFMYRDTLEISTGTSNSMASNGLLLSNGNMVNTQKYIDPNPVFPDHISDYDLVCTNGNGKTVWRYNTPGHSPFGRKIISNMSETKDGDILGCGSIRWFKGLKEDDYSQPMPNNEDEYNAPYIIKIDGDTGEEIWEYALIEYNEHGHQGPSYLKEFFELSDGSLFGGGSYLLKDSLGNVFTVGDRENSWFLRLPPDGCLRDMGCEFENVITGVDNLMPINIGQKKQFKIFPNPASEKITVGIDEYKKTFDIRVYSMSGELISNHLNFNSGEEISISNLANGNYLIRFYINNQNVQNEIFIKQ